MNLPFISKRKKKTDTSNSSDVSSAEKGKVKKKRKPLKKRQIIAIVVVGAIAIGVASRAMSGKNKEVVADYTDEAVARRDITTALTGTGTLKPINQYNVTTLVRGAVLEASFEKGDKVEKGQLLYVVDSKEVQDNIEKTKLSLQQSRLAYEQQRESLADLSVKAKKTGVIIDVPIEAGDDVKAGDTIATLRDSAVMKLKVPFNAADAKGFFIGQTATVTIDGSFETLSAKITEIDGADTVSDGYQVVRNVTLAVSNPGALSPTAAGTATVGGIACNSSGNFAYNAESTIVAEAGGTVAAVKVHSGSSVRAGDVVCTLTSSAVENQVKNAQLSLQNEELSLKNTIKSLDDYRITAPIAGTVVTKTTQVGDSIDSSSGVAALAVIYDMSTLTFDIALDELDVNQVEVGQQVQIKVDALSGKTFTGAITNISVAGTTNNGATTYPVTVQITDPPSELLPGMNVDATITTGEVKDVMAIPVGAVQRGNVVYVKSADGSKNSNAQNKKGDKKAKDSSNEDGVPAGYRAVTVKTGLADSAYIEIKQGLSEGDVVYVPQIVREATTNYYEDNGRGGPDGGPGGGGPDGGGDSGGVVVS